MQDHPQINAFAEAASILRAERYWEYGSMAEHVEFLRALGDVLTEVCYHMDVNRVLPMDLLDGGQVRWLLRTAFFPRPVRHSFFS